MKDQNTVEERVPHKSVNTVDVHLSLVEACLLMSQKKVHNLVVVDKDEIVGMLSQKNVIDQGFTPGLKQINPILRVEDAMVWDFPRLNAEATYLEALRAMATWGVSALPIMEAGNLVGIVTESDMIRFMDHVLQNDENSVKVGAYNLLSQPITQKVLELMDDIGL